MSLHDEILKTMRESGEMIILLREQLDDKDKRIAVLERALDDSIEKGYGSDVASHCPDILGECTGLEGRGEDNTDDCPRWYDGAKVCACWKIHFIQQAEQENNE